jgi:hypothetical protein
MEPDGDVSDGELEKDTPQRLPSLILRLRILRALTFLRGEFWKLYVTAASDCSQLCDGIMS